MTTDLTARIAELTAQIEEQLTEDEAAAKAAAADGTPGWTLREDPDPVIGNSRIYDANGEVVVYDEGSPSPNEAEHIARNDPARVLRRITATRSLIAAITAEPHDWVAGDEFYSCSQAKDLYEGGEPGSACTDPDRKGDPCDCGRDQQVARLLGIIASE